MDNPREKIQAVIRTKPLRGAAPNEEPFTSELLALNRRILETWLARARNQIAVSRDLQDPILTDTFPAFLEHLAKSLQFDSRSEHTQALTAIAQEHGGERARLTPYRIDQIICEYQILKNVLFEVISETSLPLTSEHRKRISNSFDDAIRESVIGFSLVQTNIRDQFVATLTHDLRGPLSTITLASEYGYTLSEADPALRELGRLFDKIENSARRANELIANLLDVTLLRSGGRLPLHLEPCELTTIILDVIDTQREEKRFLLENNCIGCSGIWDRSALSRAIENLLTNAIKYGAPDAPVTIRTASAHGRVIVCVHNEGAGIPLEEQETIFNAFQRATKARAQDQQGWGLGLALVRGVAESHGGSIAISSSDEFGTTFTIDIPCDARPFQSAPILQ